MAMPDFFVIGAFKSGTTALHYMLRKTPNIFFHPTIKETNFFAPDSQLEFRIESRSEYEDLFRSASRGQKIGEVCPSYLLSEVAAGTMQREVPDAKLIAVLRDPVDRAYSEFMMYIRNGVRTMEDLRPQLEREMRGDLLPRDRPVLPQGLYAKQLSRFFCAFPDYNIKVVLHSELANNGLATINDILQFLEVPLIQSLSADNIYNVSGLPRSMVAQRVINKIRQKRRLVKRVIPERLHAPLMRMANTNLRKITMAPELRARLIEYYRADILMLQGRIDKDLDAWL